MYIVTSVSVGDSTPCIKVRQLWKQDPVDLAEASGIITGGTLSPLTSSVAL
jgi:hypothetical protein